MTFDDVKESGAMALDTLRANKLRSSLTILGVSVGVITVIFMVSIIQGLNRAFAEQIESLGSNTIFVSKFDPSFGRPPGPEELHRKDITMDDAEALRREAPSIVGVSPIHRMIASTARYADKQTDTPILFGVTPYYEFVHSQNVGHGRFILDIDMEARSNVCILGVDVVRALFPFEEPVDKEIKINGNSYRVIGVMEPLGNFFGQSRDNSIFIPIRPSTSIILICQRRRSSSLSSCGHARAPTSNRLWMRSKTYCAVAVVCPRVRPTTSASRRRIRYLIFTIN